MKNQQINRLFYLIINILLKQLVIDSKILLVLLNYIKKENIACNKEKNVQIEKIDIEFFKMRFEVIKNIVKYLFLLNSGAILYFVLKYSIFDRWFSFLLFFVSIISSILSLFFILFYVKKESNEKNTFINNCNLFLFISLGSISFFIP